jgi:hypothetical protein
MTDIETVLRLYAHSKPDGVEMQKPRKREFIYMAIVVLLVLAAL